MTKNLKNLSCIFFSPLDEGSFHSFCVTFPSQLIKNIVKKSLIEINSLSSSTQGVFMAIASFNSTCSHRPPGPNLSTVHQDPLQQFVTGALLPIGIAYATQAAIMTINVDGKSILTSLQSITNGIGSRINTVAMTMGWLARQRGHGRLGINHLPMIVGALSTSVHAVPAAALSAQTENSDGLSPVTKNPKAVPKAKKEEPICEAYVDNSLSRLTRKGWLPRVQLEYGRTPLATVCLLMGLAGPRASIKDLGHTQLFPGNITGNRCVRDPTKQLGNYPVQIAYEVDSDFVSFAMKPAQNAAETTSCLVTHSTDGNTTVANVIYVDTMDSSDTGAAKSAHSETQKNRIISIIQIATSVICGTGIGTGIIVYFVKKCSQTSIDNLAKQTRQLEGGAPGTATTATQTSELEAPKDDDRNKLHTPAPKNSSFDERKPVQPETSSTDDHMNHKMKPIRAQKVSTPQIKDSETRASTGLTTKPNFYHLDNGQGSGARRLVI